MNHERLHPEGRNSLEGFSMEEGRQRPILSQCLSLKEDYWTKKAQSGENWDCVKKDVHKRSFH
jgi:hypothetical protein